MAKAKIARQDAAPYVRPSLQRAPLIRRLEERRELEWL
jgi:hypothetical protein